MSDQVLQVTKSAALKAYKATGEDGKSMLSNLFGEQVFNEKITDRVKTFEDALEVLGLGESCVLAGDCLPDEIAYMKLKVIAKALNEGWTPDWNNSSQYKYYPWFKYSGCGFVSYVCAYDNATSSVGSRLCFKSRELAEYAGKQFQDLYNTFLNS